MRSSKSRSRNKNNRNRPSGNIVNRVFDSSGPEGKVRGTPQQIIDKYNQLARDAQLANDRVATENFQQHAEHYLRMLAEAQREQQERQQQNQQNQQNAQSDDDGDDQQGGDDNRRNRGNQQRADGGQDDRQSRGRRGGDDDGGESAGQEGVQADKKNGGRRGGKSAEKLRFEAGAKSDDVIDVSEDDDSGLVETPENKPKRRSRKKPAEEPVADSPAQDAAE